MKRSLLVVSIGLFSLAGCTQVASVHHPIEYVAEQTPLQVWVVRRHNDSVFAVQQPRLQGDTLVGFLLPSPNQITQYVEIPANDIKQMRAREPARVRTAALVTGSIGVAVFTWTQLVHGSNGARIPLGDPNCDCDFDSICGC